ncbi:50S ribosomal protein L25/general stress protein Ctc [soil metagenome]
MADQVTLGAQARTSRGKGEARRLRRTGRVPAVAYGSGLEATPVSIDSLELYHVLHTGAGLNAVIGLDVDGEVHLTLAREVQRHPVRRDIQHVDFVVVDRSTKVTVDVPIELLGESPGADEGGVIDQVRFSTSVEVLPFDVPDSLQLDISDMQLGDVKRLGDINVPDGVELLEDPDRAVVSVAIPAADVPDTTVAEDDALEGALAEGAEGDDAATGDEAAAAEDADES